ncbi:EF-hand domain-containing protein [Thioclava sp.]|uniref:EF-hand domain-containing protein n=1 Tax=Thioclava sp. TaxID=1933450 RepID=UPI003AA877C5
MKLMSRKTIIAALLAGTSLAFTLPAVAQDQATTTDQAQAETPATPPKAGKRAMMNGGNFFGFDITEIDTNGDGSITLDEIQAKRVADAKALDANGDGMISQDELVNFELAKQKARIEARVAQRFAAQDVNGDGELSAAELIERPMPTRMFERMDRNNDGALSPDEMQVARKMMRDRMGGHNERGGKHERGGHGKMGDHGKMGQMGKGGQMGDRDGRGPQNGPGSKPWQQPEGNN